MRRHCSNVREAVSTGIRQWSIADQPEFRHWCTAKTIWKLTSKKVKVDRKVEETSTVLWNKLSMCFYWSLYEDLCWACWSFYRDTSLSLIEAYLAWALYPIEAYTGIPFGGPIEVHIGTPFFGPTEAYTGILFWALLKDDCTRALLMARKLLTLTLCSGGRTIHTHNAQMNWNVEQMERSVEVKLLRDWKCRAKMQSENYESYFPFVDERGALNISDRVLKDNTMINVWFFQS